tara:strand:- start:8376 stop:8669 length:294 start_codon:yes stop_codon:yes gene_type:complete
MSYSILSVQNCGEVREMIRLDEALKDADGYFKSYLENKKKNLLRKMKYPMRDYKLELLKYFYKNQYDDERFPHFRMCDRHIEYDDDGNRYPTYSFYD